MNNKKKLYPCKNIPWVFKYLLGQNTLKSKR